MAQATDARSLLRRYERLQVKVDALTAEARAILRSSGVGQAPPVYHRLMDRALRIVDTEMRRVWLQLRNKVTQNGRTYWQMVGCAEWETPLLPDIAAALASCKGRA